MNVYDEFNRAKREYNDLYNLINSGDYNPISSDFDELTEAREKLESAYADVHFFEENYNREDFK